MATHEEVRRLIGGLPNDVGKAIFNEFSLELKRLDKWTDKARAFSEEIGDPKPGEPGFGDALNQWTASKTEGVMDRMVDRVLLALQEYYGAVTVTKEDIRSTIEILMQEGQR